MDGTITVRDVRNTLRRQQFRHINENELEEAIEKVLTGMGLTVTRQVRLSDRDRIDLVAQLPRPDALPLHLGIEVKIKGSAGDVRAQVRRYAEHRDQLGALMLVTARQQHQVQTLAAAVDAPRGADACWILDGMPFDSVLLRRGLL